MKLRLQSRWVTPVLIALLALALGAGPGRAEDAKEKPKAQDFSLADLNGKTVKLSDYKGKVVLVNFWSSTCPPCVMEIPELNRLLAKMKGKPFAILALTGDRKKLAQQTARELDVKFTVLLDEGDQTAMSYRVYGLPTTFSVAPDGTIDNLVIGPAQWGDQSIVDYLDQLIKKGSQ